MLRINFQDEVVVLVGESKVKFNTHKDILCKSSTFFEAALSKEWLENKTRTIELPRDKPNLFSTYLQWAYSGVLVDESTDCEDAARAAIFSHLAGVYVLADKLGSLALKNCTLDQITSHSQTWNIIPHPTWVNFVYDNTVENSKLRDWIVDRYIHTAASSCGKLDSVKLLPTELVSQYMTQTMEFRVLGTTCNGLPKGKKERCYYHEHDDRVPVCEAPTMQAVQTGNASGASRSGITMNRGGRGGRT